MPLSLIDLARTLDDWAERSGALITETEAQLVVLRLGAEQAKAAFAMAGEFGLTCTGEDKSGSEVEVDDLDPDFGPFKVIVTKPPVPGGVSSILTNKGFDDWLSRPPAQTVAWVMRLSQPFRTQAVLFSPWDGDQTFAAVPVLADPSKVVREAAGGTSVPRAVGQWLLREGESVAWGNPAAQVWVNRAAAALLATLTNEVEAEVLMFRGPPVVRYTWPVNLPEALGEQGFARLQIGARWVFESDREFETRHGLYTAELARTNVGAGDAAALIKAGASAALEGARIAYQIGLNKLSLDSLKAMADLRKAVADETAKLADTTRQLAGAVAATLFAGIGVVAAKLTVPFSNPIIGYSIFALGLVLCAYMGSVILSGWQFVWIQRELRGLWRDKLYRFLPHAEYKKMVEEPVAKAEAGLRVATIAGTGLTIVLFVALLAVSFMAPAPAAGQGAPPPSAQPAPPAPQNTAVPPTAPNPPVPTASQPSSAPPSNVARTPHQAAPPAAPKTKKHVSP